MILNLYITVKYWEAQTDVYYHQIIQMFGSSMIHFKTFQSHPYIWLVHASTELIPNLESYDRFVAQSLSANLSTN